MLDTLTWVRFDPQDESVPPLLRGHYGQVQTLFPDMGDGRTAMVHAYVGNYPNPVHVRQAALRPLDSVAEARLAYFRNMWLDVKLQDKGSERYLLGYYRTIQRLRETARQGGLPDAILQPLRFVIYPSVDRLLTDYTLQETHLTEEQFAPYWPQLRELSQQAAIMKAAYVEESV